MFTINRVFHNNCISLIQTHTNYTKLCQECHFKTHYKPEIATRKQGNRIVYFNIYIFDQNTFQCPEEKTSLQLLVPHKHCMVSSLLVMTVSQFFCPASGSWNSIVTVCTYLQVLDVYRRPKKMIK